MAIAASLLPELDHEAASTRNLLALVPEAQAGWKPHPRSMPLGTLACHLAEIAQWGVDTMRADAFDVDPATYQPPVFTLVAALLLDFDAKIAAFRAALAAAPDPAFFTTWSLKKRGEVVFAMPRVAVLRSFIFNHTVHHRGQLTVYLRMLGVALPSTYGPTADTPLV